MKSQAILIHHHIFKNAGTSFCYALKKYFKDRFLECDLPNSRIVTEKDLKEFIQDNPQALAISGHHISLNTPRQPNYQLISSILLRQPLARIKSIYKFEQQQQANTSGAIQAKKLNFKEYVLWRMDVTPNMLGNYQTHYCSRTKPADIRKQPTEEELQIAITNLKKSAIVGTVERYEDFLQLALDRLREFFPGIHLGYIRLNKTSPSQQTLEEIKTNLVEELGEELVIELEAKNQLDQKLYQVAEEILSNNLRSLTRV
ncbi:MAG: hypothetical protein AB4372_01895 [Xenococcus sp. (in: cyanobacteria)]